MTEHASAAIIVVHMEAHAPLTAACGVAVPGDWFTGPSSSDIDCHNCLAIRDAATRSTEWKVNRIASTCGLCGERFVIPDSHLCAGSDNGLATPTSAASEDGSGGTHR